MKLLTHNIKHFSIILLCSLFALSCKSKQKTVYKKPKKVVTTSTNTLAEKIIQNAKNYEGVNYKYGGTTKAGMDCSGLVYTVFNTENIATPRTTKELSKFGNWIDLKTVQKGDLVFFATQKNSRNVNHVGIVTEARKGYVQFIHASTSKGVITSSLAERYWYFAFVQARRIL